MPSLFPFIVGLRYTRARQRNRFLSFISLVSLLGMVLGVMALIVVLSVMNGFEAELRQRVLNVLPHAYLSQPDGRLQHWQQLAEKVEQHPDVEAVAPFIGGQAMVSTPGIVRGVQLTGVLPQQEARVSDVSRQLVEGNFADLRDRSYGIVIGRLLAQSTQLSLGDTVNVVVPKLTVSPLGLFPRMKRFTVVGIFEVGAQMDSSHVFINMQDAARLYAMGDEVTGLRLHTRDLFQARRILHELLASLGPEYSGKDWSHIQGSLFQAVKMEKTMMAALLTIVVLVAAFNIVSILSMMVTDKRSDIAVLRTMGASAREVQAIFIVQGMTVGIIGLSIGAVLGVLLALNVGTVIAALERTFHSYIFDPSVYFITAIPSVLEWQDVIMVCVSALLLSFLATLYPSYHAALIRPAEALRYE